MTKLFKKILLSLVLILVALSLSGCIYIIGKVPKFKEPVVADTGTVPLEASLKGSRAASESVCLTSAPRPLPDGRQVKVIRVVDGDTLIYQDGSAQVRARLTGINAPESIHPSKPVEKFGKDASAYLKSLVEGQEIIVAPSRTSVDKFGRSLVWAWFLDGRFLNAHLIYEGYAQVYTFSDNPDYADLLVQCQREAREASRGLWGAK